MLLPVLGIFICIALFTPRWTLISRRIDKETRIGIVRQDGFIHFRGFITSKSATLFYVWLVSSKMKNETQNQQQKNSKNFFQSNFPIGKMHWINLDLMRNFIIAILMKHSNIYHRSVEMWEQWQTIRLRIAWS